MKAVVQVDYGSADVLESKEIDKPVALMTTCWCASMRHPLPPVTTSA